MMILRFLKLFAIVSFIIFLVEGCNSEKTCNEFTGSYLKLHFYTVYKDKGRTFVKDSTLKSIEFIFNQFNDSVHNASGIIVPLSPHTDSSAYIVKINSLPDDLVYIKYKRKKVFINYECGFRTDYTIDTLVSMQGRFDSIQIVQPEVTVNNEDHIKIYYSRTPSPANP